MAHVLRFRSADLLVVFTGAVCLAFAGGCNVITGVGDLQVGGAGGAATAAQGTTHASAGENGVTGPGVGVGSTASAGNGSQSAGPTTGNGPTTTAGVTTTTGPTSTTSTGVSNDPAQLCVDTINNYRATRGLPPMTRWTGNEACVASEATTDESMNSAHYAFMHGATCGSNAQNECPDYSTDPTNPNDGITTCLQLMWDEKNQPGCAGCDTCDFPYQNCTNCDFDSATTVCGHYLNMKSSVLTTVACGFASTWYAQDFK